MGESLQVGLRVGRFELLHEIGTGELSSVWVARHDAGQGHELCAVKAFRIADPLAKQMFVQEVRNAARAQHANIAKVLEVGDWAGGPFVALELVDGETLHAIANNANATFPVDIVVRVGHDIASGLHAAHELADARKASLRIVHRGISPKCVLVGANGDVKIIDFGVAFARERLGGASDPQKILYMAPEQVRGEVDRQCDVWATGAVLYRLLSGRAPFEGASETETVANIMSDEAAPFLPASVPPSLGAVVARAVARSHDDRYKTARELAEALQAVGRELSLDVSRERLGAFATTHASRATIDLRAKLDRSSSRANIAPTVPPPANVMPARVAEDEVTRAVSSSELMLQIQERINEASGGSPPKPAIALKAEIDRPTAKPPPQTPLNAGFVEPATVMQPSPAFDLRPQASEEDATAIVRSDPNLEAAIAERSSPNALKGQNPSASALAAAAANAAALAAASGPAELTQMAGAALGFADFFNMAFKTGLSGKWPCKVELTAPAGQSTAGGKLALQHIRLLPGDGGPALVIGAVDTVASKVDLRTYMYVAHMFDARNKGRPFPADESSYNALFERLTNFFGSQRFQVKRLDAPPKELPPAGTASSRGPTFIAAGVVVLLVFAIGAVVKYRTVQGVVPASTVSPPH